jgi:protein-S-isoprenylcysteine O-methyltransferase Ste14
MKSSWSALISSQTTGVDPQTVMVAMRRAVIASRTALVASRRPPVALRRTSIGSQPEFIPSQTGLNPSRFADRRVCVRLESQSANERRAPEPRMGATPNSVQTPEPPRPRPTIQVGQFKLVGPPAIAVLLLVVAAIIALVAYERPTPRPIWASGALWIFFLVYWGSAAGNSAPTRSAESRASRAVHERLLWTALLLLVIPIPGLTLRFLPASRLVVAAGLAIHVAALLLAIAARRYLGRNWSAAVTAKVDHTLIRSGPYSVVRHPIYTAMLGMFVGTAVVSGEVHALIGVVLIAIAYARKIRIEEATLRETFGDAYSDYQRETSALIPWML